jgi:hypothetical protein
MKFTEQYKMMMEGFAQNMKAENDKAMKILAKFLADSNPKQTVDKILIGGYDPNINAYTFRVRFTDGTNDSWNVNRDDDHVSHVGKIVRRDYANMKFTEHYQIMMEADRDNKPIISALFQRKAGIKKEKAEIIQQWEKMEPSEKRKQLGQKHYLLRRVDAELDWLLLGGNYKTVKQEDLAELMKTPEEMNAEMKNKLKMKWANI